MGEIRGNKGFVINEDGTIVRNKKCPTYGRFPYCFTSLNDE